MCDVNIATGEVTQYEFDVRLSGRIPWRLIRKYSSANPQRGIVGCGWSLNLGTYLQIDGTTAELFDEGESIAKVPLPVWGERLKDDASGFEVAREDARLTLTDKSLRRYEFPDRELLPARIPCTARYDAYGNSLPFEYDDRGRLSMLIDSYGRRISFHYDRVSRLVAVTLPRVESSADPWYLIRYEYDEHDDLVAVLDPEGHATRYEYQEHLLTRVTSRDGRDLYYQYDRQKRCVRTWFTGGVWDRQLQYDQHTSRVLVTDPYGNQTLYRHNGKGNVVAETDALGRSREDILDEQGRVLVRTGRGASQEVIRYDREKRTVFLWQNGSETFFELDSEERPIKMVDSQGNVSTYEYDAAGSETRNVSPTGAVWSFVYNRQGDLVQAVDPLGYERFRERSSERLMMRDQWGTLQDTRYDELGRAVVLQDGAGAKCLTDYDACGNPRRFRYPDGNQTAVQFDALGNPVLIVDEIGRMIGTELNEDGTRLTFVRPDGRREMFEFGLKEEIKRIVNAKGEAATLEYDEVGRCQTIVHSDGRVHRITYDEQDFPVAVTDGGSGQLMAACELDNGKCVRESYPDGREMAVSYGPFGEVVAIENADTSILYKWDYTSMKVVEETIDDLKLRYTYDLRGNRTSVRTNKGRLIEYSWDGRRRLTKMVDSGRWAYEYRHNELDLVVEIRMPNGLRQLFEYDVLHRMTLRRVVRPDSSEVCSRRFYYDGCNRLIGYDDSLRGTRRFSYDSVDHLIDVADNQAVTENYSHDANGNLLATRRGQAVTYAVGDRLTAVEGDVYSSDVWGNLIRTQTVAGESLFEYTGEGFLKTADLPTGTTVRFQYDPFARRTKKTVDGRTTKYAWNGVHLLSERTGSETTEYLFMHGSFFLAGMTRGGRHYSYVFDQLGTPTELLDDAGNIAWSADYSAYGEVLAERGTEVKQPFRFLGQYCDPELGWYYTRYRYYDPVLGRFTSPDPIGLAAGLNEYAYAPNPVNWVDPFGLVHVSHNGSSACCEVLSKCKWGAKSMKQAKQKASGFNKSGCDPDLDDPCEREDGHKEAYVDCKSSGDPAQKKALETKLKDQGDSCKSIQIDHIKEAQCGGTNDCKNLQELSQTVNASFGAQIKVCLSRLRDMGVKGKISMTVKLVDRNSMTAAEQGNHGKKPCDSSIKPTCD